MNKLALLSSVIFALTAVTLMISSLPHIGNASSCSTSVDSRGGGGGLRVLRVQAHMVAALPVEQVSEVQRVQEWRSQTRVVSHIVYQRLAVLQALLEMHFAIVR